MIKKNLVSIMISILLILSMTTISFAQNVIFIDLQKVETDVSPQTINNRTMVPVRAITEMIGCRVEWIPDNQQIEVYSKESKNPIVVMVIGSQVAWKPLYVEALGEDIAAEIELDTPATIINNRTFVPLRFLSETLGYTVDYNVDSTDIYMFSPEYTKNQIGEGIGTENCEGIGCVVPLSENEMNYILTLRTKSWNELTQAKQDNVISMIFRWWESADGYIVQNRDEVSDNIGRQMGQYFRTNTDMGVFETACELQNIDINKYVDIKG